MCMDDTQYINKHRDNAKAEESAKEEISYIQKKKKQTAPYQQNRLRRST